MTAPAFRRFCKDGLVHDGRSVIVAQIDADLRPYAYGFFLANYLLATLDARDGVMTMEDGALGHLNAEATKALAEPWGDLDDDPFEDDDLRAAQDESDREYFERGRDRGA